jgi:hypothetical protein
LLPSLARIHGLTVTDEVILVESGGRLAKTITILIKIAQALNLKGIRLVNCAGEWHKS